MTRKKNLFGYRAAAGFTAREISKVKEELLRTIKLDDDDFYYVNPESTDWQLPIETAMRKAFMAGVQYSIRNLANNPSKLEESIKEAGEGG